MQTLKRLLTLGSGAQLRRSRAGAATARDRSSAMKPALLRSLAVLDKTPGRGSTRPTKQQPLVPRPDPVAPPPARPASQVLAGGGRRVQEEDRAIQQGREGPPPHLVPAPLPDQWGDRPLPYEVD